MRKIAIPVSFPFAVYLLRCRVDSQMARRGIFKGVFIQRIGFFGIIFSIFFVIAVPPVSVPSQLSNPSTGTEIKNNKIKIRSNELIFHGSENKVSFKGDVVVEHEDMVLEADDVLLILEESENPSISSKFSLLSSNEEYQVEKIEADGHVVFQGGNHRGRSEHAEFFREKGIVILTGDPEVWEGDSRVAGSRITVFLKEGKSIVEESRVTLQPQ